MENPGIEIAWGGGAWRKNHKRVVEQNVLDAAELAEYGVEMLDIRYKEPKTMTVWRVAKHEPTAGVSYSSREFDIHIPVHHIKHRKIARQFAALTMTVIHEMMHSIRSEEFKSENLLECAATEGLAYMSEDLLSSEILLYDELSFNGEHAFLEHGLEYNKVKNKIFTNKELREIENQQNLMENKYNSKITRPTNNNPSAKDLIRNKNLNSKNSLAPSYNEKRATNAKLNQNNLTIGNKVINYFLK